MDFFQRFAISVAFQDGVGVWKKILDSSVCREYFYLFYFIFFFLFLKYIENKRARNTYILWQMLILEDLFLCPTVSSSVIIDRMIVLKRW